MNDRRNFILDLVKNITVFYILNSFPVKMLMNVLTAAITVTQKPCVVIQRAALHAHVIQDMKGDGKECIGNSTKTIKGRGMVVCYLQS